FHHEAAVPSPTLATSKSKKYDHPTPISEATSSINSALSSTYPTTPSHIRARVTPMMPIQLCGWYDSRVLSRLLSSPGCCEKACSKKASRPPSSTNGKQAAAPRDHGANAGSVNKSASIFE